MNNKKTLPSTLSRFMRESASTTGKFPASSVSGTPMALGAEPCFNLVCSGNPSPVLSTNRSLIFAP